MSDPIREAIQAWLDEEGEGWSVSHFVIVMGLERVHGGEFEATPFLHAPDMQTDYITDGLLLKADELHHATVDEDME